MAKCKLCGHKISPDKRVCIDCSTRWVLMRKKSFEYLKRMHGKITPSNHQIYGTEFKRLERIWRKSPDKFAEEIS